MAQTREPAQPTIDEFVGAAHGDFERVRSLLTAYPALLNARATWDEAALGAAAQMGRTDIAEYLLAAGAPLDICTAAMLGWGERVAALLDADPALAGATGAHGIPVLYFPVIRGHTGIAELLLARGADVNAGAGGTTALHGAALFGQPEMARWLLAHGAEAGARDYEGKTPLRVAEERDQAEVAAILRAHDGDAG
jgi:uncharacterized protein